MQQYIFWCYTDNTHLKYGSNSPHITLQPRAKDVTGHMSAPGITHQHLSVQALLPRHSGSPLKPPVNTSQFFLPSPIWTRHCCVLILAKKKKNRKSQLTLCFHQSVHSFLRTLTYSLPKFYFCLWA